MLGEAQREEISGVGKIKVRAGWEFVERLVSIVRCSVQYLRD